MDRRTDGRTDGRTDKASYRDAWTHLKSRLSWIKGTNRNVKKILKMLLKRSQSTISHKFKWPTTLQVLQFESRTTIWLHATFYLAD